MVLYFASPRLLGIPFLHIEHVLIGVAGAGIISGVVFAVMKRKNKELLANAAQGGRHEARREKIKSDIIINSIDDGVVVVGSDKVIQLFNPAAATITGWPVTEAENLAYKSVFQLVDAKGQAYNDDQDPFAQALIKRTTVKDGQAVLVNRSKHQLPINISVSPLLDSAGNATAVVGIFRDVSKERQEEQQRAEFISTASHEMRTPVAAIEGYLALALNPKVSSIDVKARSYLDKAHSSTQHLGKLFQDLLTSAKAEDGRLISHPQLIEISSFTQQLADTLKFAAQNKGLKVEFAIGSGSPDSQEKNVAGAKVIQPLYYVHVDPDRLREVITNLFDNAVKYTDAGVISLGVTGNDKVVQIFVRDTGAGIAAEDVPHLFQKFYRVDNSATRTIGGTGLGLFISRKIIELYQGRIWVESEPGKGSTFYINLPRLDSLHVAELQKIETQQSPLQGGGS